VILGFDDRRAQVTVGLVLLLLGFLLVVQLRSQGAGNGMDELTSQDLTLLVANLNTRNDQLRTEVGDLESQLVRVEAAAGDGERSSQQLRTEIARDRAWAGLDPASGQGVAVALSGPVPASAVQEILNELRNAGAEALAVGDVRVVTGTVATGDPGSIAVDGRALGNAFSVTAIGDKDALAGTLVRPGGVVSFFAATYPEVTVVVTPTDEVDVPGTTRTLAPAHGTPRL
jgi:uncharacterized protein YlxW (UPF0749 family)